LLTLGRIVYYVQFQSSLGSFSLKLSRCIRVRFGSNIVALFTSNTPYNRKQVMYGLGNNGKEREQ